MFLNYFHCTMSLQDHRMLIYQNISRKTKFMKKKFKFLKYSVYRHLLVWYIPPVNGKSTRSLEPEIWTFKVFIARHCGNSIMMCIKTCYSNTTIVVMWVLLFNTTHSQDNIIVHIQTPL